MSLIGKAGMDQLLFGLGTGDITQSASTDISTTGDIFCDTYAVTGGGTVLTFYGNRIFARKEILIGSGATLKGDGFNASGHSGGGSPGFGVGGTLSSGGAGGNGGSSGAGNDGQVGANGAAMGGAGGDGGHGGGGAEAGGSGAIIIGTPPPAFGKNLDTLVAIQGWFMGQGGSAQYLAGGKGGGGGGGASANGGGGGGAGGNVILLAAPTIRIDGAISAKGGNGGAGVGGFGNGGGGGGGGGLVILVYSELIFNGTISVNGGIGGLGVGPSGLSGANGSAGHIYHVTALSTAAGPVI